MMSARDALKAYWNFQAKKWWEENFKDWNQGFESWKPTKKCDVCDTALVGFDSYFFVQQNQLKCYSCMETALNQWDGRDLNYFGLSEVQNAFHFYRYYPELQPRNETVRRKITYYLKDPVYYRLGIGVALLLMPILILSLHLVDLSILIAIPLVGFSISRIFWPIIFGEYFTWGVFSKSKTITSHCPNCWTNLGGKGYRDELRFGYAICPRCGFKVQKGKNKPINLYGN